MTPPLMLVVAGPSGSGKSRAFPVRKSGLDYFNADDVAAMHNHSPLSPQHMRHIAEHGLAGLPTAVLAKQNYRGITPEMRNQWINPMCEHFIEHHIQNHIGFAVETTLRSTIALEQMLEAKSSGFSTKMVYIGTDDVEINLTRVRARSLVFGEHSAPESKIREVYTNSLRNLRSAFDMADTLMLFDNSREVAPGMELSPFALIRNREVCERTPDLPLWGQAAIQDLAEQNRQRERAQGYGFGD